SLARLQLVQNSTARFLTALPRGSNGWKCFSCINNKCEIADCKADEDHCITTKTSAGLQMETKGCASRMTCEGKLQIPVGPIIPNVKCCKGNLCNGAVGLRQSAAFLLVSLIPVFVFNRG
uniref:UPAR/Ly6 domain-containing protein n=1 Tax=Denticeps clupeoides TaxID=299321 RepID=A0AAY4EFA6_9TELE